MRWISYMVNRLSIQLGLGGSKWMQKEGGEMLEWYWVVNIALFSFLMNGYLRSRDE